MFKALIRLLIFACNKERMGTGCVVKGGCPYNFSRCSAIGLINRAAPTLKGTLFMKNYLEALYFIRPR